MLPDFRQFKGTQTVLIHSAKGSEWEEHKYVKKIGSAYYYPVGYDKGRTIDQLTDSKKTGSKTTKKEEEKKTSDSTTVFGSNDTKDWEKRVMDKVGKGMSDKELADLARTDFDKVLARIGVDWRKMDAAEVSAMQRQLVGKLDPGGKLSKKKEEKEDSGSRGKELDKLLRESRETKSSKFSSKKEKTPKEEKKEEKKEQKKTYSLAARNRKRRTG